MAFSKNIIPNSPPVIPVMSPPSGSSWKSDCDAPPAVQSVGSLISDQFTLDGFEPAPICSIISIRNTVFSRIHFFV